MAKTNVKSHVSDGPTTHEAARAYSISHEQELRRSVMACLLWEDTFYEGGVSITDRIKDLVSRVPATVAAQVAIDARTKQHLRHAPLWVLAAMIDQRYPSAEDRNLIGRTIPQVCLRADEPGELVAMYWQGGKKPLTRQMKVGLSNALKKFDEYQLAKYDRDAKVKIRDVMFLCHPSPDGDDQAALFKRLANKDLVTPDTWEVALSGGADKKETFERLIREKNLGAMALLRNLRNMKDAGVDQWLVKDALRNMKAERVLPFRFVSAARHAPQWEPDIEAAMLRCLESFEKMPGKTAIVVDNSGSMYGPKVSAKSEIDRSDAACALAALVREVCEDCTVISFSNDAKVVPARRGFALRDAIKGAVQVAGTFTRDALTLAKSEGYDRVIVITDEQSHQSIDGPGPGKKGYIVNVSVHRNGIGYGPWTHIDGWSESVLQYVRAAEG